MVRSYVGRNLAAPAEALALLTEDPDTAVQVAAMQHPTATPDGLSHRTAADETQAAARRAEVAADPLTPAGVLEALASDPVVAVRSAVASNPATSLRVLRLLVADPDSGVASAARGALVEAAGPDPAETGKNSGR